MEKMNRPNRLPGERSKRAEAPRQRGRLNLSQIPWLRPWLQSPWPQFLLRALTLAGFIFTIAAGLLGSRVGSHNFAIIFVWIAWWTALKLGFIPLGGRVWCSVCPIPLPGEWLQRGGILRPGLGRGLNLRWPKWLRGTWLQSSAFLLIGTFSAVTLTNPRVTSWVLLALFVLALALSLVFENRAFCTYLCPIGGFTGIYAKTAPVEVRAVDKAICRAHRPKTCYQVCPWGVYPVALRDSSPCGLCLECLRACPEDNLALNLRPFGDDLGKSSRSRRLDEAFLALVMLGSVLGFAAVFTGPWGALKSAAYAIGSLAWMVYAAGFLTLNLAFMPGLFTLAVWGGERWKKTSRPFRVALATQAQPLLPLGLSAWIAFTLSFAIPKAPYVLAVLSDPLGWGWSLLGEVSAVETAGLVRFSAYLQIAALLGGLTWAARLSRRLAGAESPPSRWANLPVLAFCALYTVAMLWLLIG